MFIKSTSLESYGPFDDIKHVEFRPGINLIVGANDSGKSFLLKALSKEFSQIPHRHPDDESFSDGKQSFMECTLVLSGQEFRELLIRKGGETYVPIPQEFHTDVQTWTKSFLRDPNISITAGRNKESFNHESYPSINYSQLKRTGNNLRLIVEGSNIRAKVAGNQNVNGIELLNKIWNESVFYFEPQRSGRGSHQFAHETEVNQTASNLAAVLNWLRGEKPNVFEKIVQDMTNIFENVENLSVSSSKSGFEIKIWQDSVMSDPKNSSPLDASGTGLGQALAILTVAATKNNSIILIDEINSYLHPGATKKLLSILETDYNDHQYIMSTHSPEVIGSRTASSINFIKKRNSKSTVSLIEDKIRGLEDIAQAIGFSSSDVFMYEKIVWVEGESEEICFDYIRRKRRPSSENIKFLSVVATSDFFSKKKNRNLIIDVYKKLTTVISPITPRPLFCFDTENLSETDVNDIRKRSQYQVHFLPARNLESFLISPRLIHKLFAREFPEASYDLSESNILDTIFLLIDENGYRAKSKWSGDIYDLTWIEKVDGAALLTDLFARLSHNTFVFRKTRDTLGLIASGDVDDHPPLKVLLDYVDEILKKAEHQLNQ